MPINTQEREFVAYVIDLMQVIGPVTARSMFGGHGIFLEGLMFGLIADSTLYLKVDSEFRRDFEERGLEPFTYQKGGRDMKMSYFQAPEEVLESIDDMRSWAARAYGAALAVASKKKAEPR